MLKRRQAVFSSSECHELQLPGLPVEPQDLLRFEVDVVTEKESRPRIRQLVLDQAVPL